uniref:Reverse transcriptase domain-containing protein n=1 Tax=Fagus sylvatica TaxID=28930 RepID=A0A2N9FRM3_FAGSY
MSKVSKCNEGDAFDKGDNNFEPPALSVGREVQVPKDSAAMLEQKEEHIVESKQRDGILELKRLDEVDKLDTIVLLVDQDKAISFTTLVPPIDLIIPNKFNDMVEHKASFFLALPKVVQELVQESRDGAFSMRLYYKMIRGSTVVSFPWKSIWRAMAPRRVLFFVWTAAWGRFRTHDNLIKRGFTLTLEGAFGVQWYSPGSSLEDMELETRALTEPLPTNQQAYRNHQLYAIERWLTKYQILHPKGPILGFCSGHPVYPRSCVHTLKTKERWLREGLQVKANELPVKELKRSAKLQKVQVPEDDECGGGNYEGIIKLYGKWQLEPLHLPHAVNGIVPKNERGQVEVWSEKCLPPGTVHLRLPRVFYVAKRLEIDYAPAMVGFEFRNGHSHPVFDGIVVCAEFKDAIVEAYAEEEERREAEERKRNEAQAISRWYQLLCSIITRQRLNNRYGDSLSSQTSTNNQPINKKLKAPVGVHHEGKQSLVCQQEDIHHAKSYAPSAGLPEDHEHSKWKNCSTIDVTHYVSNGLGNDSVEIFLKVILANGPNGKWDVKWARVVPSEASGPLPHRAHNQVTQEVNLQAHMEGPGQAKPTITQPKVKPNFQVNAPKPKWVWAPLARGLEKPEKAVEGSSSSPPPDLHLELGHDHVSVHSWDSESQLSLASVAPAPSPNRKPIDEIMQEVGVVDRSWGSSRDWFIDLRNGRRIRIPVDLRTPVADGCSPEDAITQKLIQWVSSQRIDHDSGKDSCDGDGGSDWGTVGMDLGLKPQLRNVGGAMSNLDPGEVETEIMVLDGEDPEGQKDLEPLSVEPLAVAFPSGIENAGDKVGKDYRRKASDWVLRRQKAVGKLLGASYVGYEQAVEDLLMDIEARHIQRKANMVGTRRPPSLERKGCRKLKGLETKMELITAQIIRSLWRCQYVDWMFLGSIRASDGILLMWNSRVVEKLEDAVGYFSVSCKFRNVEDHNVRMFSGVYGPNVDNDRGLMWDELVGIRSWWDVPWCLGDDFNEMRFPSERVGSNHFSPTMYDFSDFISTNGLIDIPLSGGIYTWSNNKERRRRPFHFENMWLKAKGFAERVQSWWESYQVDGTPSFVLAHKLKALKGDLKKWNDTEFRHLNLQKKQLLADLGEIDAVEDSRPLNIEEKGKRETLIVELDKLLINGVPSTSQDEICDHIALFYEQLYMEDGYCRPTLDEVDFTSITAKDAVWLDRPFKEMEIEDVVRGCNGDKALGPDGFSLAFFQHCWSSVCNDILAVCQEFHEHWKIISSSQNAFVKGRQILDLVLIANECLDGKIKAVLPGGVGSWQNGGGGFIFASPPFVSPFWSMALSRLIDKAIGAGLLSGFSMGEVANVPLEISHLLFADDTLIFCEVNPDHLFHLRSILVWFEASSGLRVNLGKSELVQVGDMPVLEDLANILGCKTTTLPMNLHTSELYRIACNKEAVVADFVHFRGDSVYWEVNFTRLVQDWELESVSSFLEVKSFYKHLSSLGVGSFLWKNIWKTKADGESIDHLLLHCPYAKELWDMIFGLFGIHWVMPKCVIEVFWCWQGSFGRHQNLVIWKAIPHCLMWCIWRERNARTFEGSETSIVEMK